MLWGPGGTEGELQVSPGGKQEFTSQRLGTNSCKFSVKNAINEIRAEGGQI